jgi:membrane fusion protein, heavy metal efflux system
MATAPRRMTIDRSAGAARLRARVSRRRSFTVGLLALSALSACSHDHGEATPAARMAPLVYTDFTDETELFVEFRPLVAGERSTFAAHFTRLSDYSPVTEGTLDVVLSGGDAPVERFRIAAPRAPGIFAPTVQPRATGPRRLSLLLSTPALQVTHELGDIVVHPSVAAARSAGVPHAVAGEIDYFKEQQWATDFAIEQLAPRPLRDSVRAPAVIRPAADRHFEISAPVPGQIRAAGEFPSLGEAIARGQVLATLLPRSGAASDAASLQAELAAARSAVVLARNEFQRAERLLQLEAVPARRLAEARSALDIATAQLHAAEQRSSQLSGEGGGIAIRSPLAGELARSDVAPGASVGEGDPLFLVVDRSELWLEAQVSESDAARVASPSGAAFELPGLAASIDLRVGDNARLVGIGRVIDPQTRSLPVILALQDPHPHLALNQRVDVRLFTGDARAALTVPASAVVDDGGEPVVFVMVGGESFSRVPVRLGVRDGDRIEVREGLAEGQRVVVRGVSDVRRAAASPDAVGHGHAH